MMSGRQRNSYFINLLLAFDQLGNTILGGDPDETISSRAAKAAAQQHKWGCYLCKFLDFLDRDHCFKVLEYDEGKKAAEWLAPRGNPYWRDYAILRWSVPCVLAFILLWLML
jgi:hypothetical protein